MISEIVIKYVKNLSERERKKLKVMLDNGIQCCVGLAKDLNVSPEDFNAELRRIFS